MDQSGVEFAQDYSMEDNENVFQERWTKGNETKYETDHERCATSAFLISLSQTSTQRFVHNDAALLMMGEGSAAWMCSL